MGILTAIFPQARRIAKNIAGVLGGAIKRRGQEQGQTLLRQDQFALHRGHGLSGAVGGGGPRQDRPGLGDGIDAALFIGR